MAKPTRITEDMIEEYYRRGFWSSMLVADFWDKNAKAYPDKEALVDSKTTLSWAQAKQHADRLALGFLELGLKRDECLVMQLPNVVDSFTVRVACEKAGIVCITPLMTLRQTEMEYTLNHVEAVAVVIPWEHRDFDYFGMIEEIRPNVPTLRHILVTGDRVPERAVSIKEMTECPSEKEYPADYLDKTKFSATDVSWVGVTSGTTGFPKFGEHPSCEKILTGKVGMEKLRLTGEDIIGLTANVVAGIGVTWGYYGAPQVAAKTVMLDRWDPEDALKMIETERPTFLGAVPAQLTMMLRHPNFDKYDVSSVRSILWAAAALPHEVALELEEKIGTLVSGYGALDGGSFTISYVDDPPDVRHLTVGKPMGGNEIRLVDDAGNDVPRGEIGEVIVRGPACSSGLFKDPEATLKVWGSFGMEGWFRTEDLGRFDEQGNLILVGRKKDMIIRGGQNIYPAEIEDMLSAHPKVAQVTIVGMPDPVMGEKACAYVVPRVGEEFTFEEMVSFLKEKKIAPYKLPERLEIMEKLPLLSEGQKIDKGALERHIRSKLETGGKM